MLTSLQQHYMSLYHSLPLFLTSCLTSIRAPWTFSMWVSSFLAEEMHASWRGEKRTASEIEGNFSLSRLLRDICASLGCGLLRLPVVLEQRMELIVWHARIKVCVPIFNYLCSSIIYFQRVYNYSRAKVRGKGTFFLNRSSWASYWAHSISIISDKEAADSKLKTS